MKRPPSAPGKRRNNAERVVPARQSGDLQISKAQLQIVDPRADVSKLSESDVLKGILAIPPAWTGVWICPFADGHIQAAGRDAKVSSRIG
jgi:DNA topoisomerase IB